MKSLKETNWKWRIKDTWRWADRVLGKNRESLQQGTRHDRNRGEMNTTFITAMVVFEALTFPIILIFIFKYIIPRARARERERLDRTGQLLFGTGNFEILNKEGKGLHFVLDGLPVLESVKDGKKIRIAEHPGSKNSPSQIQLFVPTSNLCSLNVSKENAMHTIGKAIGLTSEMQVGDPDLDSTFFFKTEDELRARSLCGQHEFRDLLQSLKEDEHFWELVLLTQKEIDSGNYYTSLRVDVDQPGILLVRNRSLVNPEEEVTVLKGEVERLMRFADRLQ